MIRWRSLLAAVLALGLAAVLSSQLAARSAAAPPSRAAVEAEDPCTRSSLLGLYGRFFRAAAEPEPGEALSFVAPQGEQVEDGAHPVFQIGQEQGERSRKLVASNRPGDLFGFFARRVARGVSFSVLSIAVVPPDPDETSAGVVFQLRLADADRGVMQAGGKGAVSCESGRFSLFQMGIRPPERTGSSCGGSRVDARQPPPRPITCYVRQ